MRRILLIPISVAAIPLLTACTDSQLEKYVSEFNSVVREARVAVRGQYEKANDVHRTLYIDKVRFTPGTKLEVNEDGNKKYPTGLVKYYSDDFIQVRLEAIDALASYTEGLAALALSDSPERAKQSLVQTGERLSTISKNLSTVTNGDSLKVAKFSTPIANLVSIVASEILEYVKNKEVKESVRDSKDAVNKLCTQLINDLNLIAKVGQSSIAAETMFEQRQLFNDPEKQYLKGSPFDRDRTTLLQSAHQTGKQRADITTNSAVRFVKRIQSVHNRLVDYIDPPEDEEKKKESTAKKEKPKVFKLKKKKAVDSNNSTKSPANDPTIAEAELQNSLRGLKVNSKAKLADYVIQELGALKGDLVLMRQGGK